MKHDGAAKRDYYWALICIIITVLVWGFSFISTKIILTQIPPISIAFFRQIIAVLVLFPVLALTKSLVKMSLKDLGILTAASFFGIVLYFICENYGLRYTTASNASMIVSALPIFTMITEGLFYKLKVTWKMIFHLVLSMVGVYLVVAINGKIDFSSAQFFGNLLVLGAIVCWVVYTIINKHLSARYASLTITAYQSFISFFLFTPLILPELKKWPSMKALSLAVVLHLVFLGVFCSAVAYFCFIFAAKRLGATVSAAFLNLIPVVTVLCGFFALQEKILWIQVAGIAIIMFSLFNLTRLVSQPKLAPKPEPVAQPGDSSAQLGTPPGRNPNLEIRPD